MSKLIEPLKLEEILSGVLSEKKKKQPQKRSTAPKKTVEKPKKPVRAKKTKGKIYLVIEGRTGTPIAAYSTAEGAQRRQALEKLRLAKDHEEIGAFRIYECTFEDV
jgi:hypothetical protein